MLKVLVYFGLIAFFSARLQAIICPDSSECPDGNTCCKLETGSYGCCPLPDATCCSDGLHCCPNGYQCDVTTQTCFNGQDESVLAVKKQKAVKLKTRETNGFELLTKWKALGLDLVGNIQCPDSSSCPDQTTCCLLSTGQYGCCPYPNAVCCNDYIHCCPYNYVCNIPYCSPREKNTKQPLQKLKPITKKFPKHVLFLYETQKITCPDQVSVCPAQHTCCKLPGGDYACCSYPKAGCCSDGVHCCPGGFYCNFEKKQCVKEFYAIPMAIKVKAKLLPKPLQSILGTEMAEKDAQQKIINCTGSCSRGKDIVKALLHTPAIKKPSPENVVCPDGVSECASGSTCCRLATGQWGCCPLPNAVCCSDGVHCCPHGYTCSEEGSCSRGKDIVKALLHTPAIKKPSPENVVCPDGVSECASGSTCCRLATGQWGCCPLPNAVCCSDGVHCCPHGYTCGEGSCSRGKDIVEALLHTPAIKKPSPENVVCPDGVSECASGSTCCRLATGQWGCCPLPNAVCCSDGVHCCPHGYTCGEGSCSRGKDIVKALLHTPAIKKPSPENVVCPDGVSECASGSTCCRLATGQWGCCPLPNAVCCSDGVHCCPHGYTCGEGSCSRGKDIVEALLHTPAIKKPSPENVVCPDGVSECASGSTCCRLATGQWGCCPLPNAVCCSDGVHCCPHGYTCGEGSCSRGKDIVKALLHTPAIKKPSPENVVCPDGVSECASGSTCCRLATGQWGCCPLPNAVCCSDGVHCCPHGYTCGEGSCSRGKDIVEALLHTPAIKKLSPENVVCPDGVSECASGSTCCRLATGQWGCCPLPNAVCCSDGVHCCPHGYTCGEGSCSRGKDIVEALLHTPAIKKLSPENVVCPDGVSECASGSTCCRLATGQWGCCPLPNAVCCSDGVHCCPHGYTCGEGSCSRGKDIVKALLHTPAIKKPSPENVVCPDGVSECASGSTCCRLATGQWGCCPLPNAVCCSDGVHCCPHGYTCGEGSCSRGKDIVKALLHTPAIKKPSPENVVCPDGVSECASGSTCCRLATGQWGCCPLPNAVCCSDGVHCCPHGYTCGEGSCSRGKDIVEALLHTPAIKKPSPENVVCPDGVSECASGSTCCRLATGQWGCCPLPNAVCCSDGVHCCPHGYTCGEGSCSRGKDIVKALLHTPAIKKPSPENVVCPDGVSECASGSTCCRLATGQWGCCPLPNAVCCSDGVHCCPHGYTCGEGSCSRGKDIVEALLHTPAIKKPSPENVVCPDGVSECASGSTCCRLATGQWGCCPLPNAVCCSDGVHCCPHGYTCGEGKCSLGLKTITATKHTPSFMKHTISAKKHRKLKFHSENVVDMSGFEMATRDELLLNLLRGVIKICPDSLIQCKHYETCCYEKCCSLGTTCSKDGLCVTGTKETKKILCSNRRSTCPFENGVCCQGGCCPSSWECVNDKGLCKHPHLLTYIDMRLYSPYNEAAEGILD